jgi:hypothetical protein
MALAVTLAGWLNGRMKNRILAWELVGIIFISVTGSLLHFVFEWSGSLTSVALIAAVNESVWEHLKLAFWPAFFFATAEHPFLRRATNNFFVAKASGLILMPLVIVLVFYSYTALIGDSILAIDIATFVAAVAAGQFVSYRLMMRNNLSNPIKYLSIVAIVLLTLVFSLFTYFPPHLPLFRDSRNGSYGIPAVSVR